MIAKINKSTAKGKISAPASKSMAHRYLICAGLCKGKSVLSGMDLSEDILATADCLKAIGAECEIDGNTVTVNADFNIKGADVCCRESGSTLRFFVPVFLSGEETVTLSGYGRLMQRPLDTYEKICENQGLLFERGKDTISVKGPLKSGEFCVPGDISSQFISGLMFALPMLSGDSVINITTPLESVPYVKMTQSVLSKFSVHTEFNRDKIYTRGEQKYLPHSGVIEGDYSNSAFLHAFNLIGGDVEVGNLDPESLQGDKIYLMFYEEIEKGTPTLDIKDCPDLAPILMTLMVLKNGGRLINTKRLRIKESDRGEVMREELSKFGAGISVLENEIIIEKATLHPPTEALSSHNDHRIAMSLSVISSIFGGEIEGAEAVSKSYPKFFDDISSLGIEVNLIDN